MTTAVHKNLTGADLHEPKGADTATASQVYVSNGAGSGSWTDASSIITNTAFTTGDLKITHKSTADTGWIFWSENTIGDGSSGASIRANADCASLFALYWTNFSDAICPVSTGRGASAVADFAAHKTITLPKIASRALGVAGAGAGLTVRGLGASTGVETVSLAANQIPSLTSTGTNTITVSSSGIGSGSFVVTDTGGIQSSNAGGGALRQLSANAATAALSSSGTNNISVTYTNASLQTVSLMQPTAFVNVMIKL